MQKFYSYSRVHKSTGVFFGGGGKITRSSPTLGRERKEST